uniref:Uncharacterized protein n=1 Tax=Myripristis murdjan TaxID=586833 RepID=A0A667YF29_9TELE
MAGCQSQRSSRPCGAPPCRLKLLSGASCDRGSVCPQASEVAALTAADRLPILTGGATLGGVSCTVVRDWFQDDGTVQLATKTGDPNTVQCISAGEKFRCCFI